MTSVNFLGEATYEVFSVLMEKLQLWISDTVVVGLLNFVPVTDHIFIDVVFL